MDLLISSIIWLAFVFVSAMLEATMFAQVTRERRFKIDEHVWLTSMRGIVLFLCFFYRKQVHIEDVQMAVAMVIMFPYLHDGIYYTARNTFDPAVYPLRWKDQSTTTDARFSLSWSERKQLFTIGFLLCVSLVLMLLLSK
jgi:hypothetical protein